MQKLRMPLADYRPDIDGLRAVAVLAVVAYHAFPTLLPGGFTGVDIFFVISGFLISKHIWEDLEAKRYSLKTFYARRVRRIFPALMVVLSFCWIAGWVILTPAEYAQLAKHITGGATFVANLVSWKEAGYFDRAADTKPLLHLWSLGIEEQFYIVWPLILAALWRRPQAMRWVLPAMLGVSLASSVVVAQFDTVADFYSPFTRFWELLLGAALAHPRVRTWTPSAAHRNAISLLGLASIATGVIVLNNTDAFPSAWALFPTVGAAALIAAGERAWLNRKVLAQPVMVWVGLISFPLYLWHWPLLSFARIIESGTPTAETRAWLVAASIPLAWLTYLCVERPIRAGARARTMIKLLCLGMIAVTVAAEIVRKRDGIATRKLSMLNGDTATLVVGADKGRLKSKCGLTDAQFDLFQYCYANSDKPQYVLLGDSKADALFHGLVRESASPLEFGWTMIGSVYPPDPLMSDKQHRKDAIALDVVLNNSALHTVIWVTALRKMFALDPETGYFSKTPDVAHAVRVYSDAIEKLERAGKHVWFVIDNPTLPDPRSCISGGATENAWLNTVLKRTENPRCTLRYSEHLAGTAPYRQFISALQQQHPMLVVYDPAPLLCDIGKDECKVVRDGKFLYSYDDHMSDVSNSIIAKDILRTLQQPAAPSQ